MHEVMKLIHQKDKSFSNEGERIIESMITSDAPINLSEKMLLNALSFEGSFYLYQLHYDDFESESQTLDIKYRVSEALSVVVSFEDDGSRIDEIENFVKYLKETADSEQNIIFGVKKVSKLSKYPIRILFSGIHPINQLRMTIGQDIYKVITSDDDYFIPRFAQHRLNISRETGIKILPLFPMLDKNLKGNQVHLVDSVDGRIISDFQVKGVLDKNNLEEYLTKLFYIYKVLME
jgi:hypothetical protein